MGDVLDVLISLIPVFVGLIWILQLVVRIRKRKRKELDKLTSKRGELKTSSGASMRAGKKLDVLTSRRQEIFPKSEQMIGFLNKAKKMNPIESLSPPVGRVKPPNSLLEGRPSIPPLEQGKRVVKDRTTRAEPSTIRRSPLDSIRARSPLAQAMLWKIIFDRPLALKAPDEQSAASI